MSLQPAMRITAVPTSAAESEPLRGRKANGSISATGQRSKPSGVYISRTGCVTITRRSVPHSHLRHLTINTKGVQGVGVHTPADVEDSSEDQ